MVNSISNNINVSKQLSNTQSQALTSSSRIASGRRINSAKDDAAGLAISDRMNSQVRGLNQAIRNTNDGISLLQTADGALSETTNILQRMRELAVQSGNSTYNASDRRSLNSEFSQLQSELDRIAGSTTFNGQKILDGSNEGGANFQVGANGDEFVNVAIEGATQENLGTASLDILSSENAQAALSAIDEAISTVSERRGEFGSTINRFESTLSNLGNISENVSAAESRIGDADIAKEVSDLLKNRILEKAGVSIQAQANIQAGAIYSLLQ